MQIVVRTLRQHLRIICSYPAAMFVVLATFLLVLYYGRIEHRMAHAVGYLTAVWLGAFVTDLTINLEFRPGIGFPIRHSVAHELAIILVSTFLGFIFLCVRFTELWAALDGHRYLIFPLILFVYPVVLALIYLFYFRYKPGELGVNFRYWYLPLFIHLIVGSITLLVAPDKSHWRSGLKEFGLPGLLFTVIICSALSEEFTRMLLQTRLGLALHNKGIGFVLATFIWAAMHIPVGSQGSKSAFLKLLLGAWTIMPIGFLWGYLTHRTKSLLPSVLVHGLNLWGLQNF